MQRYHISIVSTPWMQPQYNLLNFHPIDAGAASATPAKHKRGGPGSASAVQAQGPRLGAGGSCGDGSIQRCMVMMMCPTGTVNAVMNGCTSCVDPDTCLASNGH